MSTSLSAPALACSLALHAGLFALTLCAFSPSLPLREQVVDIEVVKPSSLDQARNLTADTVTTPLKSLVPRRVSRLGRLDRPAKSRLSKAATPSTSGPQSPKATRQVSAIVQPVYNAAYLHNMPPAYPNSARRDGEEGEVFLKIAVGRDGNAHEVDVQHSSGYATLDDAARDAVMRWRFIPARQGGETLDSHVIIPIEFKLE